MVLFNGSLHTRAAYFASRDLFFKDVFAQCDEYDIASLLCSAHPHMVSSAFLSISLTLIYSISLHSFVPSQKVPPKRSATSVFENLYTMHGQS
jgi:hypothetical protein